MPFHVLIRFHFTAAVSERGPSLSVTSFLSSFGTQMLVCFCASSCDDVGSDDFYSMLHTIYGRTCKREIAYTPRIRPSARSGELGVRTCARVLLL